MVVQRAAASGLLRRSASLGLVAVCVLLAACAARPRAVVVDRTLDAERSRPAQSTPRPQPARGEYVVVRGDTMYGIAFRHGLDFRDLARRNNIAAPYTIYPGQRLRLAAAPASPPRPATPVTTTPPRTTPAPSRPTTPAPGATSPGTPAVVTAPSTPVPTPATTPPPAPVTTPVASGPSRSVQGIHWRWPASGQIVGKYVTGDPTRQGLNIAGSAGQVVNAAADGEVVYSGAGLIGYGELVIIKHSDTFLSAYGHNRKRLVAEGQKVKAGQQIAEMGRSGAARDMLHFEIRKSGKPVDPLPFLPAR